MNTGATIGWGLAFVAVVAGYLSYGWQGLALAITVIAFWLLLQFSRALRVLRNAAGRPVGHVDNAVMLHAKLHRGMRLPQVLRITASLGQQGSAGAEQVSEEQFTWTDSAGDRVELRFRDGRLEAWTLSRSAEPPSANLESPPTPEPPALR
jgi:uncharacterized protein (DUF58 family)